ncbi:HD domain-containing protein [Patescibacteria group bacterium]
MTGKREKQVIWTGPQGKINWLKNDELLRILKHEILRETYDRKSLKETHILFEKALQHLRKLYRTYNLISTYHSFSHNYVTAITAMKGFVGALKLGKKLTIFDLKVLIIVALFHDTGYLRKSKYQEKTDVVSHSKKSSEFSKRFLESIDWNNNQIRQALELHKFTDYSKWKQNEDKIYENVLAQLLVGADFMQVVDYNYYKNLKVLNEFLYERDGKVSKVGQQKFYHLVCRITLWVWSYLDSFFKGIRKNPYRAGWKKYRKDFEDAFGLPKFV